MPRLMTSMPRIYGPKVKWRIPEDAVLLESQDGWMIYHSPSEQRLYIYPGEYHAEALPLEAADLSRFLAKLAEAKPPAAGSGPKDIDIPH